MTVTPAAARAVVQAANAAGVQVSVTAGGKTNAADTTLGTKVNEFGARVPDRTWLYGTGLE